MPTVTTKDPQTDWEKAFNAVAKKGHDSILINDIETEFDRDNWTW